MTDPLPMPRPARDRAAGAETEAIHVECWPCRHYQREQTGPNEWHRQCAILAKTFPRRCGRYEREPGSDDQVGEALDELTRLGQEMGGYDVEGML